MPKELHGLKSGRRTIEKMEEELTRRMDELHTKYTKSTDNKMKDDFFTEYLVLKDVRDFLNGKSEKLG